MDCVYLVSVFIINLRKIQGSLLSKEFTVSDLKQWLHVLALLQSLLYWDANRRESLHLLIKELLLYYKEHNIQCAGTNIRLQQDIMSLLWQANLKKDDFEVWAPKIEVTGMLFY